MLPGAPGSGARGSSSEIAAWLAAHKPEEVDEELLSRASQLGVELRVRYDGYPHRRLRVEQVGGTPETREAALADLRRFMMPAPQRELEAWLAELSVITARRQDDEFTEELRLKAYTSRLSAYPADVVHAALLVEAWRFWPSWVELEEVCKRLACNRRTVLREIEAETDREEQRDREQAMRDEARARLAAENAKREAELAACLAEGGCDECTCPELCEIRRASRARLSEARHESGAVVGSSRSRGGAGGLRNLRSRPREARP
jgi:hypothetical protein